MAVSDYDPIIDAASKEWDVDPNWVRSVMQQESGGNPFDKFGKPIRSSAGAGGLMQLMPDTASALGVQDVDEPVQNIWGGVKNLAQLRDQFHGNVPMATAAYNARPSTVQAHIDTGSPLPAETQAYIPAVAANYQRFARNTIAPSGASPPAAVDVSGMSNDDFLKGARPSSSAPPTAKAVPSPAGATPPPPAADISGMSNDDFLKMTGAHAPPSTVHAPPLDLAQGQGETSFELGPAPPADLGSGLKAIGNAALQGGINGAVAGWQGTPDILSPEAANWLGTHVSPQLAQTGLLSYGLKAAGAGMGALRAIPAAIAETGNQLGDHPAVPMGLGNFGLLGRDVAAMAENPLSTTGAGLGIAPATRYGATEGGLAVEPSAATRLSARMDEIRDYNPLSSEPGSRTAAVSPAAPAASPTAGAPGIGATASGVAPVPQSVGAAATAAGLSNMTPAEALASRSTGEMQRVLEPAKPGIDTTIYVPGTKPTEAEVSGSPQVAAEQKFNRSRNPDPHIAQEQANNAARVEYYDQAAGTPTQVQRMVEDRGTQADADLQAAFGNKQAANAQPVVDTINGILADPRLGERDAVRGYVEPYLDKLTNSDGTLKTDPEALYGIRENITDQLAKGGDPKNAGARQVQRQLLQIKGALDDAIEGGAPGYRQYLDNYSAASRPIDAMQYLQDARPSLTNAQGTMAPAAFDRFMKNTVEDRAAGGTQPAGSLTEDQMDVLHNIHSDLKRSQNINLANPRGSDMNMLTHMATTGGKLALHGVANYISPVLGSVGLQLGENALRSRGIQKMTTRVLNPNPLKYPPPQGP